MGCLLVFFKKLKVVLLILGIHYLFFRSSWKRFLMIMRFICSEVPVDFCFLFDFFFCKGQIEGNGSEGKKPVIMKTGEGEINNNTLGAVECLELPKVMRPNVFSAGFW